MRLSVCCSLPNKGSWSKFWTCWSESRDSFCQEGAVVSYSHKGTSMFLQPCLNQPRHLLDVKEGWQSTERLINQPKATQWPLDPFRCENLAPSPENGEACCPEPQAGEKETGGLHRLPLSLSHPSPSPIKELKTEMKTSSLCLVHGEAPPWGGGLGAAVDTGSADCAPSRPSLTGAPILESFFRQPTARPARLFSLGLVTPV